MTGSAQRPLLFLDVDGPLIPFGVGRHPVYPAARMDSEVPAADANPLLARINPALGPQLLALPCDPVWATTWMAEANEVVGPRVGLPDLPVVRWLEASDNDERLDRRNGLHWKTRTLVAWAAGRPFTWVDDELTTADRAWVSAHHQGQALLHRVDAGRGLTDADFAVLDPWLRAVSQAPTDRQPDS